jgi:HTH-type transcriptional regulator / antitoxin HipB
MFPYGKFGTRSDRLSLTAAELGQIVRKTRKSLGATQADLALTSGTGLRFIVDLERGKETCQIGKVFTVLQTLGIQISLTAPPAAADPGEEG